MSISWSDDVKTLAGCTPTSCSHSFPVKPTPSVAREDNVCQLLSRREICPRTQRASKNLWQEHISRSTLEKVALKCDSTDARQSLTSWVESKSLSHLSANYCPLLPPPRSTIAAAFSFNGETLASTHGDHTVKIIDYQTGKCLKVLSGHRRTPWVVRFHPLYPEILASGSLDHEVRLWDAKTANCIASRDFYRPIASIAFHAQGEILAVASGHKLYMWNYNGPGESFNPSVVLKTKRSLRAVHFHPHAAPFLLTAEVNDLDSPDTPLTLATTSGYLNYSAPALLFTNIHASSHPSSEIDSSIVPPVFLWPASSKKYGRVLRHEIRSAGSDECEPRSAGSSGRAMAFSLATQSQTQVNPSNPHARLSGESLNLNQRHGDASCNSSAPGIEPCKSTHFAGGMEGPGEHAIRSDLQSSGTGDANSSRLPSFDFSGIGLHLPVAQSEMSQSISAENLPPNPAVGMDIHMLLRGVDPGQLHQLISSGDGSCWELPFLQGWLMGQSHASLHTLVPNSLIDGGSSGVQAMQSDTVSTQATGPSVSLEMPTHIGYPRVTSQGSSAVPHLPSNMAYSRGTTTVAAEDSLEIPAYMGYSRGMSRPGVRPRSRMVTAGTSVEAISQLNVQSGALDSYPATINVAPEVATSISADSSTDLPCTVKLKMWSYDAQSPSAYLDANKCRLTIPHAVLCSEMGAHFSPCGRFLAACVACVLPHLEVEPGMRTQSYYDAPEASTSPTRHPISGHRVIYELRIYSLEEATFGMVLASRAIRAAHCLTSIQFSPTSEHILLAYGRRHGSLLRSCFTDGDTKMHIYTILEVYRVSDMELVRVLPSADDEVNVACFHPLAGCGLVYGTKEGKLRILRYDTLCNKTATGVTSLMEDLC